MNSLIGSIITHFAIVDNDDNIGFDITLNNSQSIKLYIPNELDYQIATIGIKTRSYYKTGLIVEYFDVMTIDSVVSYSEHFNEHFNDDDFYNKFIMIYKPVMPGYYDYSASISPLKDMIVNAVITEVNIWIIEPLYYRIKFSINNNNVDYYIEISGRADEYLGFNNFYRRNT